MTFKKEKNEEVVDVVQPTTQEGIVVSEDDQFTAFEEEKVKEQEKTLDDIEEENSKKKKEEEPFTIKDFIKEIVIALAITLVVLFFVAPTKVQETSMMPTINDGDILLLEKGFYSEPKRGDIVVFETDLKDENGKDMNLIKRVIGIEGDVITITNGKLYRNGEEIKEDYIYGQELGEVYNYKVPKGEMYVLGDHREVSRDSRELGPIKISKIIGKAIFRLYPFKDFGTVK